MRNRSSVLGIAMVATFVMALSGVGEPAAAACRHRFRTAPMPEPAQLPSQLFGIDVHSAVLGWAVGQSGDEVMVVRWDGTSWSTSDAPSPTEPSTLLAVSTSGAANAWAVGVLGEEEGQGEEIVGEALVERWDGTSWSIEPFLGEGAPPLASVHALSPQDVWVGGELLLHAHYDGSVWTKITHPELEEGGIHAIDSSGPDDVWFVGARELEGGVGELALVERWDGTNLGVVATPVIQGEPNGLNGVAVVSPDDVWAVGDRGEEGATQTLIEHWDGSSWSIVPSPNPGSDFNELASVTALSSRNVWAVGTASSQGVERPLILHWDGRTWSQVSAQAPGPVITTLKAVSAADQQNVWVVGASGSSGEDLTPLGERAQWRCD